MQKVPNPNDSAIDILEHKNKDLFFIPITQFDIVIAPLISFSPVYTPINWQIPISDDAIARRAQNIADNLVDEISGNKPNEEWVF